MLLIIRAAQAHCAHVTCAHVTCTCMEAYPKRHLEPSGRLQGSSLDGDISHAVHCPFGRDLQGPCSTAVHETMLSCTPWPGQDMSLWKSCLRELVKHWAAASAGRATSTHQSRLSRRPRSPVRVGCGAIAGRGGRGGTCSSWPDRAEVCTNHSVVLLILLEPDCISLHPLLHAGSAAAVIFRARSAQVEGAPTAAGPGRHCPQQLRV